MRNKKKGFTIVELVIVIAVIAILSAILIPTFAGLTTKANEVKVQEEVRNTYVAYAAENADKDGYVEPEKVVITTVAATSTEGDNPTVTVAAGAYKVNATSGAWEKTAAPTTVKDATPIYEANGYKIYAIKA